MPKVEGTYTHDMSRDAARIASEKAVNKLLESFEATDIAVSSGTKFDAGQRTTDKVAFSCKSRGFGISGTVMVKDNEVEVTVTLPIMAIAFKGLVKAAMDKHVPKHLQD